MLGVENAFAIESMVGEDRVLPQRRSSWQQVTLCGSDALANGAQDFELTDYKILKILDTSPRTISSHGSSDTGIPFRSLRQYYDLSPSLSRRQLGKRIRHQAQAYAQAYAHTSAN